MAWGIDLACFWPPTPRRDCRFFRETTRFEGLYCGSNNLLFCRTCGDRKLFENLGLGRRSNCRWCHKLLFCRIRNYCCRVRTWQYFILGLIRRTGFTVKYLGRGVKGLLETICPIPKAFFEWGLKCPKPKPYFFEPQSRHHQCSNSFADSRVWKHDVVMLHHAS